jgi:hypothetical protein
MRRPAAAPTQRRLAQRKQIAAVKRCARNVERSRHAPGLSIWERGVEVGGIIALRVAGAGLGGHQFSQAGNWREYSHGSQRIVSRFSYCRADKNLTN